jgi:hypothetical protein
MLFYRRPPYNNSFSSSLIAIFSKLHLVLQDFRKKLTVEALYRRSAGTNKFRRLKAIEGQKVTGFALRSSKDFAELSSILSKVSPKDALEPVVRPWIEQILQLALIRAVCRTIRQTHSR